MGDRLTRSSIFPVHRGDEYFGEMGQYNELVKVAMRSIKAENDRGKHASETAHAMLRALRTWLEVSQEIKPLRYKDKDGQFVEILRSLVIEETEMGFRFEFQLCLFDENEPNDDQFVADITFMVVLQPRGNGHYQVLVGPDPGALNVDTREADAYSGFCDLIAARVRTNFSPKQYG